MTPSLAAAPMAKIQSDNTPAATSTANKQTLTVGILSRNPAELLKNTAWQFSFDQLNRHPDYQFIPKFMAANSLNNSLENDNLDFLICSAIDYLMLEKDYGLLRLLTRSEQYKGSRITSEALSVYTHSDNSDIIRLIDLEDKTIGLYEGNTAISWLFLENFLSNNGLIINSNVKTISVHMLQEAIEQLKTGKLSAIISKSGLIDKELKQETLDILRIINPRRGWQAPFLHSSVLIPEWPISKAWFIEDKLANQVVSLLLNQPDNKNGVEQYYLPQYTWSIAQKYGVVQELFSFFNNINSPGKTEQNNFSPKIKYWISFIIICFLVIILIMYLRSSRDLNNRLKASKESLEQEIKEREDAQELAFSHQAELAHVARLSTMGEMASGLAHELNQPLSAIHTYVQGCVRRINMGNHDLDAIVNALQLTAQQAERAGGIIRRLRSFVRKGETHKTYSEINHIVEEVISFLESQLRNNKIKLTLELEEELPPVLVDIIQIEQVLINLLKNGIEAMHGIEDPSLIVSTSRSGHNLLELCVIDSGHGISDDKLMQIFDPFFTTKSTGMGMGLSISRSIIEAHDGKLYAKNNSQEGARFCFTLPITEEQPGNKNE